MKKHIKIFTGSSIITNRLAYLLDEILIPSFIKDHKESSRLAGFGVSHDNSELFIYQSDFNKAETIIEDFKKDLSK